MFEAWNELGDKSISIRFFDQFYTYLTGYNRQLKTPVMSSKGTLILTISSDGTFGPDDTLREVSDTYFQFDVTKTNIREYLMDPVIEKIMAADTTPPVECKDCIWVAYCRGGGTNGRIINRYSHAAEYNRKSVICDGLDHIYGVLARHMINIGYPKEVMFGHLNSQAELMLATTSERRSSHDANLT